MRALVFCAGLGTRLRPMTNAMPKCMVGVAGKPCLERIVEYLSDFGITEIMVNLHWLYPQIMEYFGDRLIYLYEPEILGTAGTIHKALPWLGSTFVVMNGDTLTEIDLNKVVKSHNEPDNYCHVTSVVNPENGHNRGLWVMESGLNWPEKGMMDDFLTSSMVNKFATDEPHFDIGTPEKLELARKHYEKVTNLSNLSK